MHASQIFPLLPQASEAAVTQKYAHKPEIEKYLFGCPCYWYVCVSQASCELMVKWFMLCFTVEIKTKTPITSPRFSYFLGLQKKKRISMDPVSNRRNEHVRFGRVTSTKNGLIQTTSSFVKNWTTDTQISDIFIGSWDTGYQFIYPLYQTWPGNASVIRRTENIFTDMRKNDLVKPFWSRVKSTWEWFYSDFLDINDYNQLGSTCLVGYLSLHIQRVLVE